MKYELLKNDTKEVFGKKLYRIKALVAVGSSVSPGDLGGYIEKEENLSQSNDAWVYGNAQVYGNARVYGDALVSRDAQVYGNAQVYGDAWVSEDARVYGDALVSGDAQVYGNAQVYGDARVSGNAIVSSKKDWLIIGPAKSSGRFITAYIDKKIGVGVSCASFTGTLKQFSDQIENTHKDNQESLKQYRLFLQLIEFNFGVKE